ncbi:MAG: hypothetical protein GY755_18870 [Chloroflexi bacterium]|nr:hypothetical protein [Chloroflexota bacterium]
MRIKTLSFLVTLLLLTSCNIPASMMGASSGTVVIMSPLDGTHLNVGDTVDILSQAGASNITSSALIVNDSIYRTDNLDTPLGAGSIYQPWTPTEAGTYTISVRVSSADGELESAKITVIVGEQDAPTLQAPTISVPTETLAPGGTPSATSILPSATSPPAATDEPTATNLPSTSTSLPPTATATIVVAANSTISGKVFRDENGSGSLNPADTPIAGATIFLGNGACPSSGYKTALTAGDGGYIFPSLPAGEYCVTVDLSSLPNIGGTWQASSTNPHSLSLGESDSQTRNFMFQPIIQ